MLLPTGISENKKKKDWKRFGQRRVLEDLFSSAQNCKTVFVTAC